MGPSNCNKTNEGIIDSVKNKEDSGKSEESHER